MEHEHGKTSTTWIIILAMVIGILAKGFFTFYVVGDHGQPDWDYRPVADVPGQSSYAVYPKLPYPQHVMGEKGE